mmetsp:Transcript_13693/g.20742  ORF Transcript_13693/g.20742 Transcript_13693/m.20742 type:complete len:388 (+) Transcript_13693:1084-2247(+)
MRVNQIVAITLTMLFMVIMVIAKNNRDAVLFQKYPLAESVKRTLAMNGDNVNELKVAIEEEDLKRIEELTIAAEATTRASMKLEKPQWYGYFHEKPITTTFHGYEGETIEIVGVADLKSLLQHMQGENYQPIALGRSKKGMVSIKITKYTDTSLGAFNEATITVHANKISSEKGLLGVSFSDDNYASVIYPQYGKLPDHHRHFVLSHFASASTAGQFASDIIGFNNEKQVGGNTVSFSNKDGYIQFELNGQDGSSVLSGSMKRDDSWSSWATSSWKIFRALGLSGIIDLWYAKHVPLKYASPVQQGAQLTQIVSTFSNQRIQEIDEHFTLKINDNSPTGKILSSIQFQPKYLIHNPEYLQATGVPTQQLQDLDHLTATLAEEPNADL